jgi:hypothetical protein
MPVRYLSILFVVPFAAVTLAQSPLPVPSLHPSYDDFFSRLRYPYHAAAEQQRRIERAARILRVGWTEQQVLTLLGPPDYKGSWLHDVGKAGKTRTTLDEYWHYVYSMEQKSSYDHPGRILVIGLSNGSKPRRVIQVDGDVPGLKPQNVPKP